MNPLEWKEEERNKVISLDAKPLQGSPCQSPPRTSKQRPFPLVPQPNKMAAACYTLSGLFTRMFPPDLATVCVWCRCRVLLSLFLFFTSFFFFFFFFSPTHKSAESSSPGPHRWARVRIVGPPKKRKKKTSLRINKHTQTQDFYFISKMAVYVYLYDV